MKSLSLSKLRICIFTLFISASAVFAGKPTDPPPPTAYTLTLADVEFDRPNGKILNYLNTTEKDIIIPDSLDGVPVLALRDYSFNGDELTFLALPAFLKEIGSRAFQYNNLHKVIVPASVEIIKSEAFDYNYLDTVQFESGSRIKWIYAKAFGGQKTTATLKGFVLPDNVNTGFKGYRGGDLYQMGSDLPYAVGDSAKDMSLTYQAIIPYTLTENDVDFDAETGTIRNFNDNYDNPVTDIIIPDNFNGTAIEIIGDNTFRMDDIKSVVIPNTIKIIKYSAFDVCGLYELIIPASVEKIEHDAFTGMTWSLGSVSFEAGSRIKIIEHDAFEFSAILPSLSLPPNANTTFMEYRNSLGELISAGNPVSDASLYYYAVCPYELTADDVNFDAETGTLIKITNTMERSVIIPNNFNGTPVKAIGDFVHFSYKEPVNSFGAHLVRLSIPGTVVNIAENAFTNSHIYHADFAGDSYLKRIRKNAFAGNAGLGSITFPLNLNQGFIEYRDEDGKVFTAGEAFSNFELPHYAIVPYTITPDDVDNHNVYGDPMRTIWSYLNREEYCIIIPDSLEGKPVEYLGEVSFISVNNDLIWVQLPSTLETIGEGAFRDNDLTEITIPGNVRKIGWYAFGNNKLHTVTFEEGIMAIGRSSFENNRISTLNLASSIHSIRSWAFNSNELVSLNLHEGVDSIYSYAFRNNLLESVTLPNTICYIGEEAFIGNSASLTSIALPSPVEREGYTFTAWKDGNGNTVTEISDFTTSYNAQFDKTGYTVSGVLPSNIYVTIEISGDINQNFEAFRSYSIDLDPGRNITITPHASNYEFTPQSISISDIQEDLSGRDFTADWVQDIKTERAEDLLSLYPNPAAAYINIDTQEKIMVSVYSLVGTKLMDRELLPGLNRLELTGLKPGIYFVRPYNSLSSCKFVKL